MAAKVQKERKTFVLDTSVLLADPGALLKFAEHEVIIPISVIGELETKRDHPELGYFARAALRALDDLRISHGRLDKPLSITPEGGTLSVELNHTDLSTLPHGFLRDGTNDMDMRDMDHITNSHTLKYLCNKPIITIVRDTVY